MIEDDGITIGEVKDWLNSDQFFMIQAQWEYKLSLWPRRCYFTNRLLWIEHHFRLSKFWNGPDPVEEVRWIHREEGMRVKITL